MQLSIAELLTIFHENIFNSSNFLFCGFRRFTNAICLTIFALLDTLRVENEN